MNSTSFDIFDYVDNFTDYPTLFPTINNEAIKVDFIHNDVIKAIFCIVYTLIFILGIFGNGIVCWIVINNNAMQTVTNLFIANLAVSDVLLCFISVPVTPLYTFLGRWPFGEVLCRVMPAAQGCSVFVSTFTLTAIAIDRFIVILYPFQPRIKLNTCACIIAAIWCVSIMFVIPYGLFMKVDNFDDIDLCVELWPSEFVRKIFGCVAFVFQFVVPFIVTALCYIFVSRKLKERVRTKPGAKNTSKEELERDRKRRTNRMLIAMVAIFGVSWLPLNMINISSDFLIATAYIEYYQLAFFVSHCIAMSSTCYNPFLYAWLNENFRKEFKQVLPFFDTASKRQREAKGRESTRKERYDVVKMCNETDTLDETVMNSQWTQSHQTEMIGRICDVDIASQSDSHSGYSKINLIPEERQTQILVETHTKSNEV